MVYAVSLIQAQGARSRSPSEAAREEEAFYRRPQPKPLKELVRVAAMVGGIALYAGLLGLVGW